MSWILFGSGFNNTTALTLNLFKSYTTFAEQWYIKSVSLCMTGSQCCFRQSKKKKFKSYISCLQLNGENAMPYFFSSFHLSDRDLLLSSKSLLLRSNRLVDKELKIVVWLLKTMMKRIFCFHWEDEVGLKFKCWVIRLANNKMIFPQLCELLTTVWWLWSEWKE